MKYAILGAGAMGSLIGAFLVKSGQDVVLVDPYKEHMDKIKSEGLKMTLGEKTEIIKMNAVTSAAEAGIVDVVIVLVKGMFTETALRSASSLFGPDTYVCTLQNGLGNTDIIETVISKEKIMQGVMKIASTLKGPGEIASNISGDTAVFLGPLVAGDGAAKKAQQIVSDFCAGGLKAEYSDNVDYYIWSKAVNNIALNAACAVMHLRIREFFNHPEGKRLTAETVKEVAAVAKAKGINLDADKVLASIESGTVPRIGEHYPSTAQDMASKKRTEIDFLNGAIARYGKELGIATPANDHIAMFVKIMEDNY